MTDTCICIEFTNGRRRLFHADGPPETVRENLMSRETPWWTFIDRNGEAMSIRLAHVLAVDTSTWDAKTHKPGWLK